MIRALLALLLLLGASGCVNRVGKAFAPQAYVVAAPSEPRRAQVEYASGWKDDEARPYDPEPFGEDWLRPVPITTDGWIGLTLPEGARLAVWQRRPGVVDRGFLPVIARTGGLSGVIPNELRLGWTPQDGELKIPLAHLANVYAGDALRDGDLVLLRVEDPEGTAEDYLFRVRRFGVVTRYGAGVLVRIPVPISGQQDALPRATLALSLTVGMRPRTRSPVAYFFTEQFALVSSVGVGSTAVPELQGRVGDPVDAQFSGAFNALLLGGGLEAFRFVSLQAQVNLSSFLRDGPESPWAVVVGFDAVQFAGFTRDIGTRLFWKNTLEPDP